MKAICDHYDLTQTAKRFFQIGGDVVLICKEPERTLEVLSQFQREVDPRLFSTLEISFERIQRLPRAGEKAVFSDSHLEEITQKHQEVIESFFPM